MINPLVAFEMAKMNFKIVTVVGLGYVGIPLAVVLAEKGYKVIGYDIDPKKIELLSSGVLPIKSEPWLDSHFSRYWRDITFTTDPKEAFESTEVIIIAVPTPVDDRGHPDLKPLISASETVAQWLKRGELVIIESTIYPGTCEEVVKPILERSGLSAENNDFYLAHCPERIDPGNPKYNIKNIPRVIGALTREGLQKALEFYRSFIDADIVPMNTIKEAEAVKVFENSFRDINIAFVNELAKAFDIMGIDIINVIKGASSKPFGFLPHWPGIGVGGHCIPVDPYYLIEKSREVGFKLTFMRLAREINESMPDYAVYKIMLGLNEIGKSVKGSTITVLGVAYKGNIDDTRNSPALVVIEKLKELGANVRVFDPFVKKLSTHESLEDAIKDADCVVIATDHKQFREIDPMLFKKANVKVILDGRNILDKDKIEKLGIVYKGIGRGEL